MSLDTRILNEPSPSVNPVRYQGLRLRLELIGDSVNLEIFVGRRACEKKRLLIHILKLFKLPILNWIEFVIKLVFVNWVLFLLVNGAALARPLGYSIIFKCSPIKLIIFVL